MSDKKNNTIMFAGIVIIAIVAFLFFYDNPNPSNPGTVDIGTEVPAHVDTQGNCVGREGIEMGICCAKWDEASSKEVWVLCEDLVEPQAQQTQAFFQFEGANKLAATSSVMFTVRVTNSGNIPTDVAIDSVTVTATTGGDAAAISEIKNAFTPLVGSWRTVQPNGFTEYSMNSARRIRLDIPSGVDAFTMKNGVYNVTLNLKALDDKGAVIPAGSRSVQLGVEQEVVAFNIDVVQG